MLLGNAISDLIILSTVLFLAALTADGWGRLTFRLVGLIPPKAIDTSSVWLGFAVLCALAELIQLFVRLDAYVTLIIVIIGIGSYSIDRHFSIASCIRNGISICKKHIFLFSLVLIVTIVWCLRAMGSPNNVDSGLYHFQTIRWLNEHPLIFGLANVHWRFAFNQSYFGFLALLNLYPFWGKGYAAGGIFLLTLSMCTLIEVGARQTKLWRWTVGGVLFVYFGYVAGTLSSPAPDIAIGLVEIAIALLLMRIALSGPGTEQTDRDFLVVAVLCFTAVTIKLSGVAFSAISIFCGLIYLKFKLHTGASVLLRLAALIMFATVVHSIRSYILSGTIMFPSTALALVDKEWSLQLSQILFEKDLILSFARRPDILNPAIVLGNWEWFPEWFARMAVDVISIFVVSFFAMVVSIAGSIFIAQKKEVKRLNVLYLPLVGSVTFWFLTAPDIRFLGAVLPLFLATGLWLAIRQIQLTQFGQKLESYTLPKGSEVALACGLLVLSTKLMGIRAISLEGWQPIPQVHAELRRTDSGFYIFVPGGGGFCWDHPLPCAPIFHPNLRFKDAPWTIVGTDLEIERKYFTTKTNPDPTKNQIYRFVPNSDSQAPANDPVSK
ncbi:LIC_10190 family membrane protein [Zwartia hollandica]